MLLVLVDFAKLEILNDQNDMLPKVLKLKLKLYSLIDSNLVYLMRQQIIHVEYYILLKFEHLLQYFIHLVQSDNILYLY